MVMPTEETVPESAGMRDELALESFGYHQELKRSFTLFGMIGFAFSVLTCWTALGGSLVVGITAGGPPVIIWGWLGVCAGSMCVAYSFAEICSAYPIAGGQYSWVAMLAPPKLARGLSYVCGWFLVIGFLSAGAANGFIGADFVLGLAQLAHPSYTIERWHTCLVAYLLLVIAALVNIFGRHLLERMGRVMIIFNLVSFVLVIVVVLAMTDHKQTGDFVFKNFQNFTGFPDSYAALLGLLQSAFGMTGYDATAHMTEELADAKRDAPKAIIWSVWIGAVTGWIFLVVLCFCVQNIDNAAMTPTGVPLFQIVYDATGSLKATLALMIFITIISLVSLAFLFAQSSRVVFSFARDNGLPFSGFFKKVDKKRHVPTPAILLVLVINVALMSIYFGSITGFNTVLAISTEGFYLSYIMPVLLRIYRRISRDPSYQQKELVGGEYSLGKAGMVLNVLGLLYLTFTCITFNFPSVYPVNAENMNYTSAAVGVCILVAVVTWFTTGMKRYTGPERGWTLDLAEQARRDGAVTEGQIVQSKIGDVSKQI